MPGLAQRMAAYQQNTEKKKHGQTANSPTKKRVGKLQQKLLDPGQFESAAAANMPNKPVFQVDDSAAEKRGVNTSRHEKEGCFEKSPVRRARTMPGEALNRSPTKSYSDTQNALQPQRRGTSTDRDHSTLTKADYDLHPDRKSMDISEHSESCGHAMFSAISMNHGNYEREKAAKDRLNVLLQREMRDTKVAQNYAACRVRYLRAVGKLRPVDYYGSTDSLNDSFNSAFMPSPDLRARRREVRKTEREKKGRYDELKETWHDYDDNAMDKPLEPTPEELELENDLDEIENEIHEEWEDFTEDVLQSVEEEKEAGIEEEDDDIELWRQESDKLKKDAEYRKKRKEERIKRRQDYVKFKKSSQAKKKNEEQENPDQHKTKHKKKKDEKDGCEKYTTETEDTSGSTGLSLEENEDPPELNGSNEDLSASVGSQDNSSEMKSDVALVRKHKRGVNQQKLIGKDEEEASLEEDILANVDVKERDMQPKRPTRAKSGDLLDIPKHLAEQAEKDRLRNQTQQTQPRKKKELRIEYDNGIPKEITVIVNRKGGEDGSCSSVSDSETESESEASFISASGVEDLLEPASPKKSQKKADSEMNWYVSPKDKKGKHNVLRIDTLPAQQFYDGTEEAPFIAWTHRPLRSKVDGSQIIVKVPPRTDCWRKTRHNFVMDNAPHYWHRVSGNFEVMVKVSGDFQKMYDKAGIMIRLDAENWICSGLEFFNDELNHMTCVTKDYTDWSMAPIAPEAKEKGAWICIKRIGNAYESFCSMDGRNWRQARQGVFTDAKSVRVGIFAACPMGESYKVTFDKYRCKNLL